MKNQSIKITEKNPSRTLIPPVTEGVTNIERQYRNRMNRTHQGNSYETAYMSAVSKLYSSTSRMSLTLEDEETIIRIANKL